jgi:hypothetical protein
MIDDASVPAELNETSLEALDDAPAASVKTNGWDRLELSDRFTGPDMGNTLEIT